MPFSVLLVGCCVWFCLTVVFQWRLWQRMHSQQRHTAMRGWCVLCIFLQRRLLFEERPMQRYACVVLSVCLTCCAACDANNYCPGGSSEVPCPANSNSAGGASSTAVTNCACNAGYSNCNNDMSDGCETATGSDEHNWLAFVVFFRSLCLVLILI